MASLQVRYCKQIKCSHNQECTHMAEGKPKCVRLCRQELKILKIENVC